MPHFPGLKSLNHLRHDLHDDAHFKIYEDFISKRTIEHIGKWIAHKPLTVVCLPLNLMATGLGSSGMVLSACVVGGLKVAIFALTLGHYKPGFPSGYILFYDRTRKASREVFKNLGELAYDAGDILYQSFRAGSWLADKTLDRLGKGFQKANEKESGFTWQPQYVMLHESINARAQNVRVDPLAADRSYTEIFSHSFYSMINVPICAGVGTLALISTVAFTALFVAKVALYATTNLDIPVPTYVGRSAEIGYTAFAELKADAYDAGRDVFILMYKVSSAIGCRNILATVRDIVHYIPEALFS